MHNLVSLTCSSTLGASEGLWIHWSNLFRHTRVHPRYTVNHVPSQTCVNKNGIEWWE